MAFHQEQRNSSLDTINENTHGGLPVHFLVIVGISFYKAPLWKACGATLKIVM